MLWASIALALAFEMKKPSPLTLHKLAITTQSLDAIIDAWPLRLAPANSCQLLGATGSGKSSFIEALAGKDHQLGISGSTLESVTQNVQTFKVVNMERKWQHGDVWPVFIVDTPGFLDSKMSEVQILNKVNQWIERNG
ncbi:hypothetical protein CVT24_000695 [Panaeolus cyanescens]|uniref:G domain-containing protein n=1 Tax=Panaeolus cyanescens TaxID=181874 RepID=A0A409WSN2_9AGAR|nr:hypothetical protein CVT24_000695 [Panaeolus cyanescens]